MLSKYIQLLIFTTLLWLKTACAISAYDYMLPQNVSYIYGIQFQIMMKGLTITLDEYAQLVDSLISAYDSCGSYPSGISTSLKNYVTGASNIRADIPYDLGYLSAYLTADRDTYLTEGGVGWFTLTGNGTLGDLIWSNHEAFYTVDHLIASRLPSDYPDYALVDTLVSYNSSCGIESSSTSSAETLTTDSATTTTSSGSTLAVVTSTISVKKRSHKHLVKRALRNDDFGSWVLSSSEAIIEPLIDIIESYETLLDDFAEALADNITVTDDILNVLQNVVNYTEYTRLDIVPEATAALADLLFINDNVYINNQTIVVYNFSKVFEETDSNLATYKSYYIDDGRFAEAESLILGTASATSSSSLLSSSSSSSLSSSLSSSSASSLSSLSASSTLSIISSSLSSVVPVSPANSLTSLETATSSKTAYPSTLRKASTSSSARSIYSTEAFLNKTTSSSETLQSISSVLSSLTSVILSATSAFTTSTSIPITSCLPSSITTNPLLMQSASSAGAAAEAAVASSLASGKIPSGEITLQEDISEETSEDHTENIATTVVTVTSCSDHACTKQTVTTGISTYSSNVNGVDVIYTTYCPLTAEQTANTGSATSTSVQTNTASKSAADTQKQTSVNSALTQTQTLKSSKSLQAVEATSSPLITFYEGGAARILLGNGVLNFILVCVAVLL